VSRTTEPDFNLQPDDLGTYGTRLNRPECVLCMADGSVVTSNAGGGVTLIRADGSQRAITGSRDGQPPVMTNGFAISPEGDFLLADLHGEGGGAWRLSRDGDLRPLLTEIGGRKIPPANFVGVDQAGRIWITVSTRHEPRALAYRPDIADGFIVLIDKDGPRIVAEGLGYTNEAIVHPSGDWLYVNETMARCTSRFAIAGNGDLGRREVVTEYGHGMFPDGLAFDKEGCFWMTSVVSNRVVRVDPAGRQTIVIEECDSGQLDAVDRAYLAGKMGREHLDAIETKVMKSISSIAFGGPDRRTAYLGNLLDDRLYTFRSPVAGARPSHWDITL
jgi:hypothetical protein